MTYEVEANGRTRRIDIARAGSGFDVSIDGRQLTADVTILDGLWSLILEPSRGGDGQRRSFEVAVVEQPPGSGRFAVHVDGCLVMTTVAGGRRRWSRAGHDAAAPKGDGPQQVTAPMPGRIVKVLVRPGDIVTARQPVVVVEAMKMENELRAPKAGRVARVAVSEGASVEAGAVLAVIE